MLTPTEHRKWGHTAKRRSSTRRIAKTHFGHKHFVGESRIHRLNLHFYLLLENTNVYGENVVDNMRKLRATWGGPLTVVWDGGSFHHKAKAVRKFLAKHPAIRTEKLSAYAPEMNLDASVWVRTRYGHWENLAANADWLRDQIITELVYLKKHPEILNSFTEKPGYSLRL
jgi:hypothetical protein